MLWVFLTQFDKLLMSKFLSLEEFGYYSLIVSVSSGIMMLSGPVSVAILPRLTALYNSDNKKQMTNLFLKSTSLVSVTVLPISLIIIVIPDKILYLWTGNIELSSWGWALSIYSLGSIFVVYSSFLHYIQFAHGNLKYHLRYGLITSAFSIPLIYILAVYFSVEGVALIWLARSSIGIFLWAPFVFYKFLPGYYKEWLINNILYYAIVDFILIYFSKILLLKYLDERLYLFIIMFLLISCLILINYVMFKKVINKSYELRTNSDRNI
nr:MATE family efflux transporter [Photobacterium leiognathi]